jgi:hypothetical protein
MCPVILSEELRTAAGDVNIQHINRFTVNGS